MQHNPKFQLLIIFTLFVSTFFSTHDAFAHATPVAYEPENASLILEAPETVSIHYSERVDIHASSIEVYGPDGARIDARDAYVAAHNPRLFQVPIPDRGAGAYTVSWKVLSADDGHFSKGAFIFSVGTETGTSVPAAQDTQVVYRSDIGEATTIFVELMGMGILIALILLHLVLVRRRVKYPEENNPLVFDAAYERRFMMLFVSGVVLILGGTLSYVAVKSADLATFQSIAFSDALRSFVPTVTGSFTLYRTGLAILCLIIFFISRKRLFTGQTAQSWLLVLLGLLAAIALARGRVSHAAASHFLPHFSIFIMSLQVFWKTFWFGGVAVLLFVCLPAARKTGDRSVALVATMFSKLASIALAFVGASGAYIIWLDLKDPSFVLASDWGRRFVVLALIGGILFLVRVFHQFYVDRVLAARLSGAPHNSQAGGQYLNWFSRTLPLEFLVGIALLFVTSFMVITTPPVGHRTVYERSAESGGTTVTLSEHRFETGKFLISVADSVTGKQVVAEESTITLTHAEKGIGPIVAHVEKRFEGGFVFDKALLSPHGQWKIEITVPQKDTYDSVAAFTLAYPADVDARQGDPNKRMFDGFAILNVLAAMAAIALGYVLYRYSATLERALHTISAAGTQTSTLGISTLGAWALAFGAAAVPLVVLWFGYAHLLKSGFQFACERDGNAWHSMVPMRDGKPTSQISESGCMALGGTYFFADPREYAYFFAPVRTETLLLKNPAHLRANEASVLTFTLTDEGGAPVTDLVQTHERLAHVIIVSEDMTVFSHTHPEQSGGLSPERLKAGSFSVRYTFPKAGRYLVSVDYAVRATGISKQFAVDVAGAPSPPGGGALVPDTDDLQWTKIFGDYAVRFSTSPGGPVRAGAQTALRYQIAKNNAPVTNLEPYLGAAMHLAIVKADLGMFVHTHGEVHLSGVRVIPSANSATHFHPAPPSQFGPDIEAHVTFPEPGLYYVFGEFNHAGKVTVTKFMVQVE